MPVFIGRNEICTLLALQKTHSGLIDPSGSLHVVQQRMPGWAENLPLTKSNTALDGNPNDERIDAAYRALRNFHLSHACR
jgi:hypothetical protein